MILAFFSHIVAKDSSHDWQSLLDLSSLLHICLAGSSGSILADKLVLESLQASNLLTGRPLLLPIRIVSQVSQGGRRQPLDDEVEISWVDDDDTGHQASLLAALRRHVKIDRTYFRARILFIVRKSVATPAG